MYNGIFEVTFNEPYADQKKSFKFETYKSATKLFIEYHILKTKELNLEGLW